MKGVKTFRVPLSRRDEFKMVKSHRTVKLRRGKKMGKKKKTDWLVCPGVFKPPASGRSENVIQFGANEASKICLANVSVFNILVQLCVNSRGPSEFPPPWPPRQREGARERARGRTKSCVRDKLPPPTCWPLM